MINQKRNSIKGTFKRLSTYFETNKPWFAKFPQLARIFIPWFLKHPRNFRIITRLAKGYKNSVKIRGEELQKGTQVPPFLIISITSQCNLKCTGCYAAATGILNNTCSTKQLGIKNWKKIIKEASDLGVFGFIIAGGEPFILKDLLKINKEFKNNLFVIFSNGTLLKRTDYEILQKLHNTVVITSLEGNQQMTNNRRGKGVYEKVFRTITNLDRIGVINGISVTINKENYEFWMKNEVINDLMNKGVRIAFFLEYIPTDINHGKDLMLSNEERKKFRKKIIEIREKKNILIVHSPGDEEYMGGCVSAGRGFAHVTPSGDLTPCPVSDIATHNLTRSSFKEGLRSDLFSYIRDNEHMLETEGTPCALFAHQKELDDLAIKVNAYRTFKKNSSI